MRAPRGAADGVLLRYVADGEPRTVAAVVDEHAGGETWWRAELPVRNPVVALSLAARPAATLGYRWLNGVGTARARGVPGADDFALALDPGAPALARVARSSTRSSPTGSRQRARRRHQRPTGRVPREWDRLPEGRSREHGRELFGGDLPGIEPQLDHIE